MVGPDAGAASETSAREPPSLTVVSYNVLAPIWAAPRFYPDGMDVAVLDPMRRRAARQSLLRTIAFDIACLQEVTESELAALLVDLGPSHAAFLARNGADYWSGWQTPELGWEPNGPAIVVRNDLAIDLVFRDVEVSTAGNHAAVLHLTHRASGLDLRIVSVHLDADEQRTRLDELRALLRGLPALAGTVDVVAGDLNEGTAGTALGDALAAAGFADALDTLGVSAPTHPVFRPGDDLASLAVIDHVLTRGGRALDGRVVDSGVWAEASSATRIETHLRVAGSDHLPIVARIGLT